MSPRKWESPWEVIRALHAYRQEMDTLHQEVWDKWQRKLNRQHMAKATETVLEFMREQGVPEPGKFL